METYAKPVSFTLTKPKADEMTIMVRPEGMAVESIKQYLDEYLTAPERIKGNANHDTLESFLLHVNTFKEADRSAIYADQGGGVLQCVYDYHKLNDPKFCDHKAYYNAKKSKQWNIWTGNNGNVMGQGEFAAFIENNALDLIDPPGGDGYDYTLADNAILKIGQTLNTSLASASKVIELSRSFQVHERATATAAHNPSTGELTVEYVTEHKDASGGKLKVPGLFVIAIPVYEEGHNYRVVVRLRYRLKEGKMLWFYELYQPEKCIEDAFNEICKEAGETSGLTVYRGKPERA
jgi:uncharacterized protein YfdQ (DUF2303 family)